MVTSREVEVSLTNVEAAIVESDEDPLQGPFVNGVPRAQRGRLGWWARAAILATVGLAGATFVLVLHSRSRVTTAHTVVAESKVATSQAEASGQGACLCLFDVDRTLTGKQRFADECPGNVEKTGVFDNAFGGGDLTLSALGEGVKSTFCGDCHRGIVSAGSAGGPDEKAVLEQQLRDDSGEPAVWSGPDDIRSQFVIGCPNPQKAQCAQGVVDWFAGTKGISIPSEEVYFFDDLTGNTHGFAERGFNARQVSCHSRMGALGLCGARPSEVVREKGVQNCD